MELRSLGKYRLVETIDVPSDNCTFCLVRHEDEPEDGAPSYIAKLLRVARNDDGGQRKRFAHEIKLLQAFNHPSIATAHAGGEQDGVAYIVMDRVEGVDLAALLGHRGSAPIRAIAKDVAVYIMGQLADALHHMHTLEVMGDDEPEPLGVVHRNICPANVVVSASGDAVLTGFGNATSRWLDPTADDPAAGDPAYRAPERVAGSSASEQSDLFAMAVMLWEMLRGERCLVGATPAETLENVRRFDISHTQKRVSGLSPKLSEILRKNLDRDVSRRYDAAYQMLARLSQAPEAQAAEPARASLGAMVRATMP